MARYRCSACGNLTRFDVVATRRTRAFHHFSIGGEETIEEETVLEETIEEVSCRWCASGKAVEVLEETAVVAG
jgi:rubredoxin